MQQTVDFASLRFGLARDPGTIEAARLLQGRVYLERGFVDALDGGVVDDPYVGHAGWFVAIAPDGAVVGVCRQLTGLGPRLPSLARFELTAAHRAWADRVGPREVAELSALAVDRGRVAGREVAAGLYRLMWQHAFTSREPLGYWVANVSERLLDVLNGAFGFGFEPMGAAQAYVGPPTVPCRLELGGLPARMLRTRPEVAAWFLEGLPEPALIDLVGPRPQPAAPAVENAAYAALA